MTGVDSVRRKGARSRAARQSAQFECRGAPGTAHRQRTTRPGRSDPTSPVKLPHRTDPYRPADTLPAGARSASSPPATPPREAAAEKLAVAPRCRSVSFDLEAGSSHEITPYAEIYGLHPSEFLFERHGFVLLLDEDELGCYSPRREDGDSDEDEESDEDKVQQQDASEDNWVVVSCM